MTQEQNQLIFELTQQMLKVKLAEVEIKVRLGQELLMKELKAWIAASMIAAMTAALAALSTVLDRALTWGTIVDENDITNKFSFKVMSITKWFTGLSSKKIMRIFQNKFKPINLYRLCHLHDLRFNAIQDHNCIRIEYSMLRLRKTSRTYKTWESDSTICGSTPSITISPFSSLCLAKRP